MSSNVMSSLFVIILVTARQMKINLPDQLARGARQAY
jgi:hypothetical protein